MRTKVDLKNQVRSQIMLAHREVWGRARDAGEYWGGGTPVALRQPLITNQHR